jgi:hypothetical protein
MAIVLKALKKAPDERYRNRMDALADDLSRYFRNAGRCSQQPDSRLVSPAEIRETTTARRRARRQGSFSRWSSGQAFAIWQPGFAISCGTGAVRKRRTSFNGVDLHRLPNPHGPAARQGPLAVRSS